MNVDAGHEAENAAHGAARSDAIAAAVRRAVPSAGSLTLLDYGCGPGHIGLRLAGDFGRVIMADTDPVVAEQARAAGAGLGNVEVRVMDLTRTVPPDVRADVVVSSLSWHHIADLDGLLEAYPLVAPGGRLLVADLDYDGGAYHAGQPEFAHIVGYHRAELVELVGRHGYGGVAVADLWRGTKWIAGRRTPVSLFLLTAAIPGPAG